MPETLMPLLTGLFLVFAGMLIGYFLWFRDRTQDEIIRRRLQKEAEDLNLNLKKQTGENTRLADQLNSHQGKLHILQELCDDLVTGREQYQSERVSLESDVTSSRKQLEDMNLRLDDEKQRRMMLEEQLHKEQQETHRSVSQVENDFRDRISTFQSELGAKTNELTRVVGESSRAVEKLHIAEGRIAELESELHGHQSMLETARKNESGLEKEYVSLETSLRSQAELLKEARGQAAAALSAKQTAEEALGDLREQSQQQQTRLQKMDELTNAAESARMRCLTLEQSLENSNDRLTHLTIERDNAIVATRTEREGITGLQTRLENQETTIRQLRSRNEELLLAMRQEKESRLEMDSIHKRMQSELEMEVGSTTQQIEHLREINTNLNEQLVEAKTNHGLESSQMRDQLEELARISTQKEELSVQFATLRQDQVHNTARLNDLQREIESLTGQRDELARQLAMLEQKHVRSASRVQEQAREMELLMQHRDDLASQLELSKQEQPAAEVFSLEQQQLIQDRITSLITQRDQAYTDVSSLRNEIERLRNEMGEFKSKLDSTNQEPTILSAPFGQTTVDNEYGGRVRVDEYRGVVYTTRPDHVDDLKLISGVAQVLERKLNDYGVYTFKQIMEWDDRAVQEFSELLETFKDRIYRDDWRGQAGILHRKKYLEGKKQAA